MKKFRLVNNSLKGTYFLCLFLPFSNQIKTGKLGIINYKKGYYLYIGSAFSYGGLNSRILRHLNKNTKIRWHIDYLKIFCTPVFFGYISNKKIECKIASILNKKFFSIKGFGSSDCKCPSHLFYSEKYQEFLNFEKFSNSIEKLTLL